MRSAGGDDRALGPGWAQWPQKRPASGGQYQACTLVWGTAH